MVKLEYYTVTSPRCGNDFFNGGNGQPCEWETTAYDTKEEAEKAMVIIKAKVRDSMNWAPWWVAKYAKDENFKVEKHTCIAVGRVIQ